MRVIARMFSTVTFTVMFQIPEIPVMTLRSALGAGIGTLIVASLPCSTGWAASQETVPPAPAQAPASALTPGPAPAPAVAPPAPATCTSALSALPAGATGPQITAVTPASFYEGSVVTLRIDGKNLITSWTIVLCSKSPQNTAPPPTIGPIDKATSNASLLNATLTAGPGTSGTYAVYFSDASGKLYDSSKTITVNGSDDTKYVPCAAPGGTAPINVNLQCSFSAYSYDVAYDSFGKGVANHFLAIYVAIQNKNQSLEYLLQDIRGGFPDYVVSSYDKQVPHDISVKAEQLSARAIIFRVTAASASILTGIAGFAGSTALQQASNVFAGPAQTGLQSAIPDLSTAELSNLDRLGFSVTSTVIPKGGAISVIAFIPSEILEPAPNTKHHLMPQWRHNTNLSTYKGNDLKNLFKTITVQIAGTHVQQVTPSPVPTMKLFVTPITTLADFTKPTNLTIEGSGLDSVKSVQLIDGKTVVQAQLKALPNATSTSIDPNVAVLAIPASDAGPGKYEINFILADGTSIDAHQSITIPTPPAPAPALAPAPAPAPGTSKAPAPVAH